MSLSNRSFIILFNSKEYCCYNSSTPSLAARKFFSNINKSNKIKKIEFFVKETTEGSKKKIYGPYIGNETKVYLKNKLNKMIGGYIKEDLLINQIPQEPNNIPFAKKGNDCIFFKPILKGDKYYYQYIVCKTLLKNYEFETIIGNKIKNIEIIKISIKDLEKLKIFMQQNVMFRSLHPIIDEVIKKKTTNVKIFENKQQQNQQIYIEPILIKEAFVQKLSADNNNIVITLSDLKVKKLSISGTTYIFFNPVSLTKEKIPINPKIINYELKFTNSYTIFNYYYRYIIYIKDNQLMCKEVFLDPQTSKISLREINISQINKENLAKLNNSSREIINGLKTNLSVKNIYNALNRLTMQNQKNFSLDNNYL